MESIISNESGKRLTSAFEFTPYFEHVERRSRTQTLIIQMVFFLAWLLSVHFSTSHEKNKPWHEAILISSVMGSMLMTYRAPNFKWRLLGRMLFEILIAQAIALLVTDSVYFTFWMISLCCVLMVGMAPLHHEPLSYSLCALLVCASLLLHQSNPISVTGEKAWMFYLLIFSFGMGLVLNMIYFLDRIRWFETHRRLQDLAYKDGLTGLKNRRAFIQALESRLNQPKCPQRHFFFLIDIDDFKRINDLQGHGAGDEVLRAVAQRIDELTHPCLNGRLGGEEFGVLVDGSRIRAEQMADEIVSSFTLRPLTGSGVTVSIGIAEHHPSMTLAQWMKAADEALYEVKRHAKNGYRFSI